MEFLAAKGAGTPMALDQARAERAQAEGAVAAAHATLGYTEIRHHSPAPCRPADPLSLIGILPAHFELGAFFTATSMIGFIAGAGIIVRNSIILVDFIELKLREGMPLEAAVEEAGVVRFRPMLLTATAVLVGSAVMLADPIFQGLAVSLMAGEVAATALSRVAVPVLYFLVARRGRAAELQREGARSRGRLLADVEDSRAQRSDDTPAAA
jgi:hypothetical protein